MKHTEMVEKISAQHIAILGKTGSGKTYAAKGIVEHLLKHGRQTCVLDPTGAWWGLRLGSDGKARGFDVVLLGGKNGDIPLADRSGAAVARLVTEQRASVVIDTSGFTVGEYTRWFIDFASTLYTTVRSPLHLVIDEAHYFMPQGKAPDVDAGRMLHAGNRLMSGGRSLGIRGMMITQRPAKLHKDSLTCADTLIAMRVLAPQDRQAIKDWIDGSGDPVRGKAVLDSLAQLARGQGWVWYPEGGILERATFPLIKTYDSSATPTHGQAHAPAVAQIDLNEVRRQMADAVKDAEANDPKLLRARVAELQKQLAQRPEQKVERHIVERPVVTDDQVKRVETIVTRLEREGERRIKAGEELASSGRELQQTAREFAAALYRASAPPPAPTRQPVMRAAPAPRVSTPGNQTITARQQRFLDAAATLTTLGAEVSKETVCGWVGVHPRGGSVGEEMRALADAGMIDMDRGRIAVTTAGMAAANQLDPSQAISTAKSGLTDRQRRFFEMIADAYPDHVTKEQIADRFGIHPRGGSLGEDLGRLVGRGLVDRDRGTYRARDFLFAAAVESAR